MKSILFASTLILLSITACGDKHNPSGKDMNNAADSAAATTPDTSSATDRAPSNTDNRPDSISGNTTGRGNMKVKVEDTSTSYHP